MNCLFEESRLMTTNASPKTRLTLKKLMLRSGFAEQFVEADILLFIEPERVLITRCSGVPVGHVCQFSVGIHNIGSKGVRLGRTLGLAERAPLSDKCQFVGQRYSSLLSDDNKKPRRKNFRKNFAKPPLRLPEPGLSRVQYYNRAGARTSPRCGLERTLEPKRFILLYIAAERNFSLFGYLNL